MGQRKNQFIAPKNAPDGTRGDLRRHCEFFAMRALDENDMKFLSHLYRTIRISGGKISIETNGEEFQQYNFL